MTRVERIDSLVREAMLLVVLCRDWPLNCPQCHQNIRNIVLARWRDRYAD